MDASDRRGERLRTFDASAAEFTTHMAARVEAGAGVASRDISRLTALAGRLIEAIRLWLAALEELESGAVCAIDPQAAARRLMESVFDDLLIPEAARVLASALDLAWSRG